MFIRKKQRTVNHIIIFNDWISKFYQKSRGFPHGISVFFSICFGKKNQKNAEAIKFLGILKKYLSKSKIYFCLKKKSNVSLNKKVMFVVFHTIFKLDFITQIISLLHSPQMCVFSFRTFFVLLYQFLRNRP